MSQPQEIGALIRDAKEYRVVPVVELGRNLAALEAWAVTQTIGVAGTVSGLWIVPDGEVWEIANVSVTAGTGTPTTTISTLQSRKISGLRFLQSSDPPASDDLSTVAVRHSTSSALSSFWEPANPWFLLPGDRIDVEISGGTATASTTTTIALRRRTLA